MTMRMNEGERDFNGSCGENNIPDPICCWLQTLRNAAVLLTFFFFLSLILLVEFCLWSAYQQHYLNSFQQNYYIENVSRRKWKVNVIYIWKTYLTAIHTKGLWVFKDKPSLDKYKWIIICFGQITFFIVQLNQFGAF